MKRYLIMDGLQIMLAILMTGSMAYAMQPTASEKPQGTQKVEVVQSAVSKPKATTQAQEKPADVKKTMTWQDNPNHCDQTKQYIAKEEPFQCLDKPVPTANVAPAAAQSASDDGSAKMFIYMHESGNNPGAINSGSGACGLGQALPCSKMPCSLSDYACQDNFFTGYMQSRYGTWENAKAFWLSHRWW